MIVHKTPIIISNSHVDDPSMGNFGKIWRMGWYLQSNKSDLDSMYDVESKSVVFESTATMLSLYAFCDDLYDADVAEYIKGRLFRYWFNEDTVKGDYDGHIPDYTRNAADSVVNGRYDLINLFAARLDLKPFIDAWGSSVRFELSAYSEDTMRYCTVNVNPNEVGKIYTDDTFTRNANVPLHSAPLTALHYDGFR